MARVLDVARRVAQVDSTVLLTGESGVGKERMARFIHHESARTGGPVRRDQLRRRPGEPARVRAVRPRARVVHRGDAGPRRALRSGEWRDAPARRDWGGPAPMQVKLLRVLQERQIRRVGENKTRAGQRARAGGHQPQPGGRDPRRAVPAGSYYRLKVIEIVVPPLRERREDILPLARWFLAATSVRTNRKVSGFTPAAAHQLLRYAWPGNVRELENAVERAVVLARRSRIDVDDLPPKSGLLCRRRSTSGDVRPLADVERDYIRSVLRAVGGNRAQAAARLGIRRRHVYRKLKQYGGASV